MLKCIWNFWAVLSMKMIQFLVTVCLQFHFVLLMQQVLWTWQRSSLAFLQFWNWDPVFGIFYGWGMLLILVHIGEWKAVDIYWLKTSLYHTFILTWIMHKWCPMKGMHHTINACFVVVLVVYITEVLCSFFPTNKINVLFKMCNTPLVNYSSDSKRVKYVCIREF